VLTRCRCGDACGGEGFGSGMEVFGDGSSGLMFGCDGDRDVEDGWSGIVKAWS
jgi:hypothetical protein